MNDCNIVLLLNEQEDLENDETFPLLPSSTNPTLDTLNITTTTPTAITTTSTLTTTTTTTTTKTSTLKYLSTFIIITSIILILILISMGMQHKIIEILQFIQNNSQTPIGYATFILLFTLVSVVGIPVSIPSLAGGFIFPFYYSIPLVISCVFIAGSLGFFIGKYLLHRWIMTLSFTKKRTFVLLYSCITTEAWKISFLVRLSQILPFAVGNYLLACTPIPYFTFITTTVIGTFPGLACFIYIGSLLTDLTDIDNALANTSKEYALMLLVIGSCIISTLTCITCISRRAYRQVISSNSLAINTTTTTTTTATTLTTSNTTTSDMFDCLDEIESFSSSTSCASLVAAADCKSRENISSNSSSSTEFRADGGNNAGGTTSSDMNDSTTACDSPSFFNTAISLSTEMMDKLKNVKFSLLSCSSGDGSDIISDTTTTTSTTTALKEPFTRMEKTFMIVALLLSTLSLIIGIPLILILIK